MTQANQTGTHAKGMMEPNTPSPISGYLLWLDVGSMEQKVGWRMAYSSGEDLRQRMEQFTSSDGCLGSTTQGPSFVGAVVPRQHPGNDAQHSPFHTFDIDPTNTVDANERFIWTIDLPLFDLVEHDSHTQYSILIHDEAQTVLSDSWTRMMQQRQVDTEEDRIPPLQPSLDPRMVAHVIGYIKIGSEISPFWLSTSDAIITLFEVDESPRLTRIRKVSHLD